MILSNFAKVKVALLALSMLIFQNMSAQELRVAPFYGNRPAAVSYTFDDGLLEHYTELFPVLKQLGLRCTFAVNGNTINNAKPTDEKPRMTWAMMKEMSDQGQEISSHGWAHIPNKRITGEALRFEIQHNDTCIYEHTGRFPRTFFYANNVKGKEGVELASRDRVGTRTFQVSVGSKRNAQWLHDWIRGLIRYKKWGVTMTHGISRGYDHFPRPQVLFDHLKDASLLQKQDSLWIATFHDVAAYVKERDEVVLQTKAKKRKMLVKPSLALDKRIFVMPLTLIIPEKVTKARQGNHVLLIQSRNGEKYVDVDPFGKTIKLEW